MARTEIDQWRETCPVAGAVEMNGFRLDNYLPNRSEILAGKYAARLRRAVAQDGGLTVGSLDRTFGSLL